MNYAKCPNLIELLSRSLQPKNYPNIKNIMYVCAIISKIIYTVIQTE